MNAGVYQITNTANGKCYIGSSVNIARRLREHMNRLRSGTHFNAHLQSAYNAYGEKSFEASVLVYCDKHTTLLHEQRFLDTLKPAYNIATDAAAPNKGRSPSARTRAKLSAASTGKVAPFETRQKISQAQKGRVRSAEEIRRHSESLTGYKHTEETRQKMSESGKGKVFSEEAKANLRAAWEDRKRRIECSPIT